MAVPEAADTSIRGDARRGTRSKSRQAQTAGLTDLYDEFAIGWNELFDQEPVRPAVQPVSTVQERQQPDAATAERQGHAPAQLPPTVWSAEAVQGKEPPSYLRIPGGKQGFIDRAMKQRLQYCPVKQIRKPAEVMDSELDRLRKSLNEDHHRSRKEARQLRRLGRRCRVKVGENLDELEERYLPGGQLQSLAGPDGNLLSARSDRRQSLDTKEFFSQLGRRQTVQVPHTAR
eukprot:TRINITY_DN10357_c0_g1_i1.p1 TRINITY_DN10357_c0_g1~~TRINITY_DN10357_c0_g1_i1.p1  ORF type:complete len:231 (+),score=39.54 TRINITY_DN10357_c0_g1_i1:102-794(+)